MLLCFPLVFFGMIEGGLRLFGYGDPQALFFPVGEAYPDRLRANPRVSLRYFKQDDQPPIPRQDYFLKVKPVNGYRIFMLGGSTAVGWPYGENMMPSRILARRLAETFPETNIEVVNLAFTAINTYSLLDFVDEILEQSPDAVLIYSGHNEFYGALGVGSARSVGRQRWLVRAYLQLQRLRLFQLLKDWIGAAQGTGSEEGGGKPKGTLMQRMVADHNIPLDGPVYQLGVRQYTANLHEIISRFKDAGVAVMLSELVSNLKGHAPFSSVAYAGQPPAGKVYRQAQVLEAAGEFAKARVAYRRAKDLDALRFRAPAHFNEIVRRLGDEYALPVVPMQAYFEKASPNGIIGAELMMEHLHPNATGYFLMSEAFFDTMREAGWIAKPWPPVEGHQGYRQRWGVTEFDHVLARLRITHLTDSWPYTSLEASGQRFSQFVPASELEGLAVQVFTGALSLLQAHRRLASDYQAQGKIEAALGEYRAMIEIFPYGLDLYREAAWAALQAEHLDVALPILLRTTRIKPVAEAHLWIGQIYLRKQDYPQAIHYFEQARVLGLQDDPQLRSLLQQAYAQTGQHEKPRALQAPAEMRLSQ